MAETKNDSERTITIQGEEFRYSDLQAANAFLLLSQSGNVDRALEIIRAATGLCGASFDETQLRKILTLADRIWELLDDPLPESVVARSFNEENPVGSPVQYWPEGRDGESFLTRTVSAVQDSYFGPLVLLADCELLVSVRDIQPAPWAASILQAEGCC